MSEPTGTLSIPQPPKEIFRYPGVDDVTKVTNETARLFIQDHIEYPEEGGILTYLKHIPFPKKGFPTPQSTAAINTVKAQLMTMVRFFTYPWVAVCCFPFLFIPWKFKIRIFERWVEGFSKIAKLELKPYYLLRNR